MKIVVGIGTIQVTRDLAAMLVTRALGCCIGVTVYDPEAKIGGLLRFLLPQSPPKGDLLPLNPFIFADPGIPLLLEEACKLGGEKSRLQVKVAGGARLLDYPEFLDLGERNHAAAKEILLKNDIQIRGEEMGGCLNRSIRLEISTGRVWVRTSGEGEKEI